MSEHDLNPSPQRDAAPGHRDTRPRVERRRRDADDELSPEALALLASCGGEVRASDREAIGAVRIDRTPPERRMGDRRVQDRRRAERRVAVPALAKTA